MQIVTTNEQLAQLIDELEPAEYLTVDTEFARTVTYYAKLCLIQIASSDVEAIVDPLANGLDIHPLLDFLIASPMPKVMHAARQDMEIFHNLTGKLPSPVFDTQIAAMVCGFGDSVGYDALIKRIVGKQIDKSLRFTDWTRRPLNQKLLNYALGDVTHLRDAYEWLRDNLAETGREEWLREEMATLTDPSIYVIAPEDAWFRVKSRGNDRRYLARVKELAAWRERTAQKRDWTRNRVLRDEVLLQLASHPPDNIDELMKVKTTPKRYRHMDEAKPIFDALKRAAGLAENELPRRNSDGRRYERLDPGPVQELVKVLLKLRCKQEGVAQKLIASAQEIEMLSTGRRKGLRFLEGWRYDLFGKDALALLDGKLMLSGRGREIVVERRDPGSA